MTDDIDLADIDAMMTPRGRCLRYGMINSPWTHHVCRCTGYTFKRMFYGQAMCECGDLYLQHGYSVKEQEQ